MQSDEHHQEMQAGSLVAVWELAQPKLWRVLCVVLERGERAETQDPLDARRYGRIRGNHRSDHRFEACGDTIAGKGGVEAGIKPSKGGCYCSSCDRAAAQRIYGVLDGSGQRQQVAKVHSHITNQINNEIVCQLYLDIPTQARTPATQCKRHILYVEARAWPFNGQTARNQTKPSTPLYYPYDFGAHRRSGITNGPSRRITSDHEILSGSALKF